MQTREGAQQGAPAGTVRAMGFAGLGQATRSALAAFAGCLVLIAVGTLMSICWTIHPLLTLVAGAAVLWAASRAIGHAMRAGNRS